MYQIFKKTAAGVNSCSAMGAETIQKTRVRAKNHKLCKNILTTAVICLFFTVTANAQVQTATLQQADGVQVFYGIDALNNAVNAAQDGNTIYLSAGNFNGVSNLAKAIKIVGAGGFNANEAKNTFVQSFSEIKKTNNSDYLELEGFVCDYIYLYSCNTSGETTCSIRFQKIRVKQYFSFGSYSCTTCQYANIEVNNCLINDMRLAGSKSHQNIFISNCIINNGFGSQIYDASSLLVSNSIIYGFGWSYNISFQNNVIVTNNNQDTPISVQNNIFTGANNFPSINKQSGNWENVVLSDLFVNQPENKWDASYDYHLKTPQNYIGTDGTQVGIYGGLFPWNPVPSNPQIIESKVNPTTTNDGKLNFQIKAEAQQ